MPKRKKRPKQAVTRETLTAGLKDSANRMVAALEGAVRVAPGPSEKLQAKKALERAIQFRRSLYRSLGEVAPEDVPKAEGTLFSTKLQ